MIQSLLACAIGLTLFLFSQCAEGAESEIRLPTILVQESASFETLREDSFLPTTTVRDFSQRAGTLDSIKWNSNFPGQNYGYPSGASGINLGGRSIEDTQVMTLGVPLNLPQGGGADLSFFPSYLWDQAIIGHSPSSSGFSPQAVSGSLELIPWTRAQLRQNRKSQSYDTRFTGSYDRQVQTLSIGTRKENIAILAGASTGQQRGPSGSLSYQFYEAPGRHFMFHVLGTDLEGDLPGTPPSLKTAWRVIPVLESRFDFSEGLTLASTLFADVNGISTNRTEQFGIENAIVFSSYTIALSARHVKFTRGSTYEETPVYLALTDDIFVSRDVSLKPTLSAVYQDQTGIQPGGKISAKFSGNPKSYPFAELASIAKMPTLSGRYFVIDSGTYHYQGNPNLKPERANMLSFGLQQESHDLKTTTLAKAELRDSIQVNTSYSAPQTNTTLNGGSAYLLSFSEEALIRAFTGVRFRSSVLLTYSRLKESNLAYPDLPAFSVGAGLELEPIENLNSDTDFKYMGDSTAYDGRNHPAYALLAERISYALSEGLQVEVGVDDLLNSRAEVVLDFPLPGRIYFASLKFQF